MSHSVTQGRGCPPLQPRARGVFNSPCTPSNQRRERACTERLPHVRVKPVPNAILPAMSPELTLGRWRKFVSPNPLRLRTTLALCWLAVVCASACAQPAEFLSSTPESPYLRPELEVLMDAVTFHLSFDADSLLPEMAAGDVWAPQVHGRYQAPKQALEFAPGLSGRALVLGTGCGIYPRQGNLLLEKQGAIALWVKPLEWCRPNGSNVVFVMTSGARFYLQRQGPMHDKDGKTLRHEHVQFLAKATAAQKHFTCLYGGQWENDQWYFLVANWSWPNMALSVNGGAFSTRSLHAAPEQGLFGGVVVGAGGGDRGLLDEVMFFRRPLALDEVKLLYSVGKGME